MRVRSPISSCWPKANTHPCCFCARSILPLPKPCFRRYCCYSPTGAELASCVCPLPYPNCVHRSLMLWLSCMSRPLLMLIQRIPNHTLRSLISILGTISPNMSWYSTQMANGLTLPKISILPTWLWLWCLTSMLLRSGWCRGTLSLIGTLSLRSILLSSGGFPEHPRLLGL